jgi:activator of HSP90 ATPase
MAKWGEGDPRWLVEHREDGKNVNNWHWTATTKMTWVKERLGELFNGIASPLPNDKGMLTITGLKEVNGEVGSHHGFRTVEAVQLNTEGPSCV